MDKSDDNYNYPPKVIGKNGNVSQSHWTPQSCRKTTPAPTTTTTAAPTTTTMGDEEKAQAAEDNVNLKQELQDLKQQYHAIGETMYEVVKDNASKVGQPVMSFDRKSFTTTNTNRKVAKFPPGCLNVMSIPPTPF